MPFTFEVARDVLARLYAQQQASPAQKFVSAQLVKVKKIWVDPRYGRLVRSGTAVVIYPPTPPKTRSDPKVTPTTTAPATSTTP